MLSLSSYPRQRPVVLARTGLQVAFWSAARNPACDESSLSARLSSLMVPCSDLDSDERLEFLASCAALVAGAVASRAGNVVRSIC